MFVEQESDQGTFIIRSTSTGEMIYLDKSGKRLSEIPDELTSLVCPLKSPLVVHLELTRGCNLGCRHCYIGAPKRREAEMSTDEWKGLLRQLRDLQTLVVYITGGDPRQHKGCAEILGYADEIGLSCNMVINGVGLTPEFISEIPDRTFVVVSYDGPTGTPVLRGVASETVMAGVQALADQGKQFAFQGVLFHDNAVEMTNVIRQCRDLGHDFQLIDILPIGVAKRHPELLLRETDLEAARAAKLEWCEFLAHTGGRYPEHPVANPNIYRGIADLVVATDRPEPGVFVAYVTSDGWLYPDSYYAAEGWYQGADLRKTSFAEAWRNSFAELRRLRANDFRDCPGCPARADGRFCDLQNLALSQALYGSPKICGVYPALRRLKTTV